MFYVLLAIRACNIIENFNYVGGFLMIMGAALFFATFEVFVRIEYKKKMEEACKEKENWQSVAKIKTVFYSLIPISLVLVAFTYAQIMRFLGWEDLPENKYLLIAAVCILLVSVPVIGIFNFLHIKHEG